MNIIPKIVVVSVPEYTIDGQPDYVSIGRKIDKVLEDNFEGVFLSRALSVSDHPQYSLDQLVDIIVKSGSDKYDPNGKGVEHDKFSPYNADIQASELSMIGGKLSEPFGANLVKLFYENVLLDRGYRLRIDLILLYDPEQMTLAEKIDKTKPGVDSRFEKYLWRFKNQSQKQRALLGIVKILR